MRVMVARDGHMVMHRQVVLNPRLVHMYDPLRAAHDLALDAVTALAGELQSVLADAR